MTALWSALERCRPSSTGRVWSPTIKLASYGRHPLDYAHVTHRSDQRRLDADGQGLSAIGGWQTIFHEAILVYVRVSHRYGQGHLGADRSVTPGVGCAGRLCMHACRCTRALLLQLLPEICKPWTLRGNYRGRLGWAHCMHAFAAPDVSASAASVAMRMADASGAQTAARTNSQDTWVSESIVGVCSRRGGGTSAWTSCPRPMHLSSHTSKARAAIVQCDFCRVVSFAGTVAVRRPPTDVGSIQGRRFHHLHVTEAGDGDAAWTSSS